MKTLPRLALQVLANHFAGLVWSLLVIVLLGFAYSSAVGRILLTIVTVFFSLSFAYNACWNQAFKDRNYVKFGRMQEDRMRGLKAGLLASIPHLIIVIGYYIFRYCIGGDAFDLVNVIARVWFLPYLELIDAAAVAFPLIWILLLIPMPLACLLGYQLGYRDYSLTERLIFVNAGKKGCAYADARRKKREARNGAGDR